MRSHLNRVTCVAAILAALFASAPIVAQEGPIALGDDPRIAAAEIDVGVFATGLDFPMGMVELPDNSILVATSTPDGGSFFNSTGSLVRLIDQDGDGVADDADRVLATDLLGPIVAVARAGDYLFATGARYGAEVIYTFRRGERWRAPLELVGTSFFNFRGGEHQSYALAVRPALDSEEESYELFFNVGAYGNLETGRTVGISGLINGEMDDASIYRTIMTIPNGEPVFTAPEKIATGLRNASGLVFDPQSGDLIIAENGIDTPENRIVSLGADEIDVIPREEIGGAVEDFGFPDSYVDYHTGERIGKRGIDPAVAFTPIGASENEGIVTVAPVPESFPEPFAGGYIAGFHGQFDSVGGGNEENPLLFVDLDTGVYFQLIANDNPGVGHLDSMIAAGEALFVADLCANGSLQAAEPCGIIYRITAG